MRRIACLHGALSNVEVFDAALPAKWRPLTSPVAGLRAAIAALA